jgi:hypothetical protein
VSPRPLPPLLFWGAFWLVEFPVEEELLLLVLPFPATSWIVGTL